VCECTSSGVQLSRHLCPAAEPPRLPPKPDDPPSGGSAPLPQRLTNLSDPPCAGCHPAQSPQSPPPAMTPISATVFFCVSRISCRRFLDRSCRTVQPGKEKISEKESQRSTRDEGRIDGQYLNTFPVGFVSGSVPVHRDDGSAHPFARVR